jgi:hypothetical protein
MPAAGFFSLLLLTLVPYLTSYAYKSIEAILLIGAIPMALIVIVSAVRWMKKIL